MERNEIIKALECFHQRILNTNLAEKVTESEMMAVLDALSLIKSQEQRIFDLEKRLRYLLQSKTIQDYDEVDIHTKEYVKDIHSLDANIEHLNEWNKELTRELKCANLEIEHKGHIIESYMLQYGTVVTKEFWLKHERADTVKEMKERLIYTLCINNEENTEVFDYAYTLETIDQIAKEMVEGV